MLLFGLGDGGVDRALEALQGGLSSNCKFQWANDLLEVLLGLKDRREAESFKGGPDGNRSDLSLRSLP